MFGINGQPFLRGGKGCFGQNGCSLSARATPKTAKLHAILVSSSYFCAANVTLE